LVFSRDIQELANVVKGFRLCFHLLTVLALPAQEVKEFEKKVTEFTLANGLHFILVERHEAPVVSFHTYVNAGSVDDPSGETGIAHMFEHLAFKGTETIGTRNWADEKKAMDAIEEVYDRLNAERNKGAKADQSRVETLQTQVKLAVDRAEMYGQPNEFTRLMEENGGVGLNAATSLDSTEYFCSLPSNRTELWFLMESNRFLRPVFRQFYKERDIMLEEYRQQMESRPKSRLFQSLLSAAFVAHPYKNPTGGWPSDIASLRRADAQAFLEKYYVPANMAIAMVGDVNVAEARRMAERYFGPMQTKPLPPVPHTQEPPQPGPKISVVDSPMQPMAAVAYKRPDQYDKDDAVFDAIQLILSSGRTGLLYKEMVEDKRLSTVAQATATFPNGRYPNLFAFFLVPSPGHTVEENEKALDDLLARFKAGPVDAETLQRAKTQVKADVLRLASGNSGLAKLLALYYASYGDWRKLFTSLDQLGKVTAEDVQRVAQRYFVLVNRTAVFTAPSRPPAAGGRQ
jgi:predicted Zn-dependent peptidase